jgi:hypothetical protein
MQTSLHCTGDIVDGRAHYDQALALYEAAKYRSLASRFGQDIRVSILSFRSLALETLGYPKAALTDMDEALKDAREIDHAPSLMYARKSSTAGANAAVSSVVAMCWDDTSAALLSPGQRRLTQPLRPGGLFV